MCVIPYAVVSIPHGGEGTPTYASEDAAERASRVVFARVEFDLARLLLGLCTRFFELGLGLLAQLMGLVLGRVDCAPRGEERSLRRVRHGLGVRPVVGRGGIEGLAQGRRGWEEANHRAVVCRRLSVHCSGEGMKRFASSR